MGFDCVGGVRLSADRELTLINFENSPINKIEAQAVPGMRIGTITTEHVKAEEVYLAVPEEALMDSDSAHRCDVLGPMFENLKKNTHVVINFTNC